MSTLTAYDNLGRGLDMSSTNTGAGYLVGSSGVTATFIGALNDYTIAYSLNGAGNSKYMLLSGVVNLYTYDVILSGIAWGDANYNPLITWDNAGLALNLRDNFSGGIFYSILNGDDLILGNKYNDVIKSGAGNDFIAGGKGNDIISGESGTDSVGFQGSLSDYKITYSSNQFTVTDTVANRDGIDKLNSVEYATFSDGTYLLADLVKSSVATAPSVTVTPTYALAVSGSNVNEGSKVSFSIATTNVASGTALSYSITGINGDDVVGGSTDGSVTVDSKGKATVTLTLAADKVTEGIETLTFSVKDQSVNVAVAAGIL